MSSFHSLERYLASARNGHDRPAEGHKHNTRVCWRGEDAIAIRLHSTDIVTYFRDGRIQLANGGWNTVTTMARLRDYGATIISNGGDWLVPFEHDPNDPPPQISTEREIPKPFHAPDPGPEPVDDGVGCRVGEVETYEVQEDHTIYHWRRPGAHPLDLGRGFPVRPDDWNREQGHSEVRLTAMHTDEYIGANLGWGEHQEVRERGHEAKVCAHCAAFAATHATWRRAMHGRGYGSERERHGYADMIELLETYGTREVWQEAYITEFREVRENRKLVKAWAARNRASFHNGIEVLPSGEVPLKHKRAHVKAMRRVEREERQRQRQREEFAARRARHEQMAAEQRRVKALVAEALAGSIAVTVDKARPGWHEMVDRNRKVAV